MVVLGCQIARDRPQQVIERKTLPGGGVSQSCKARIENLSPALHQAVRKGYQRGVGGTETVVSR